MSRQARLALMRARDLIGAPFRPQGRDVALGLDCLGLAAISFDVPDVPADYRLRGDHLPRLCRGLERHFRRVSRRAAIPGDLMLFDVGRGQIHLAVKSAMGAIHADAWHGVVEMPGTPSWSLLRVFRRRFKPKA